MKFYLATFEISADGVREIEALKIVVRQKVELRAAAGEREILTGPEATRWFPSAKDLFPPAATLAQLAAKRTDFVAGEKLEPVYLRETSFVKAPPARALLP